MFQLAVADFFHWLPWCFLYVYNIACQPIIWANQSTWPPSDPFPLKIFYTMLLTVPRVLNSVLWYLKLIHLWFSECQVIYESGNALMQKVTKSETIPIPLLRISSCAGSCFLVVAFQCLEIVGFITVTFRGLILPTKLLWHYQQLKFRYFLNLEKFSYKNQIIKEVSSFSFRNFISQDVAFSYLKSSGCSSSFHSYFMVHGFQSFQHVECSTHKSYS